MKAAYTFNLVKAVHWPEAAFGDTRKTIHLCVAGNEAIAEAFKGIDGKQVGERIVRVSRMSTVNDYEGCQILFVSKDTDRTSLLSFFAVVKDKPVLIIGESAGFARIGGLVNFFTKNDKLRFEINPREVERHGLKISSRILQLATIVESE